MHNLIHGSPGGRRRSAASATRSWTGTSGVLVGDGTDLDAFGHAVQELLDDPARAAAMGKAAHERALDFMPDLHLMRWADILVSSGRAS